MSQDYFGKNRIVARVALKYKPQTVLDVGCGTGKVVKILRDIGIEAYGLDKQEVCGMHCPEYCWGGVEAQKLPFSDKSFDVVVSNDFFEHIPEEEVIQVYNEMQRIAKKAVVARISLKPYKGHITVKPMEWWKEKLPNCHFIGKEWEKN